jgi:hypothetical protein
MGLFIVRRVCRRLTILVWPGGADISSYIDRRLPLTIPFPPLMDICHITSDKDCEIGPGLTRCPESLDPRQHVCLRSMVLVVMPRRGTAKEILLSLGKTSWDEVEANCMTT